MRIVGVDHGDRWFGLAICDGLQLIARPLEVVRGEEATLLRLRELVEEEDVGELVVGLPLNMDGTEGPRARKVREFMERLEREFGLPVHPWDERLSSFEAEGYLREGGLSSRKVRERVDMVAAQILLQGFIDHRRRESSADPS